MTVRAPSADTIRRIERSSGAIATHAIARMDEELPWFSVLPPETRSFVTLVAQSGIASFVAWIRNPGEDIVRLTSGVFGAAPPDMARRVSLQQTVELVQVVIDVVESEAPPLARKGDEAAVLALVLQFSREIAFAAARVYARAAETRGAWDARLEALVIDGLVRGDASDESSSLISQLAALGWRNEGAVTTIVGWARSEDRPEQQPDTIHREARHAGYDALVGVHRDRLIVLLGGTFDDPMNVARDVLGHFSEGPVVVGGLARTIDGAARVTGAALNGLRAVSGWPGAPRPVAADDLLPERVLIGDETARDMLIESVYRPLAESTDVLLETAVAYLDSGRAIESTARALFVHPNTVRYRLRKIAEATGQAPTDARGAFTLQMAIVSARLAGEPA